MCNLTNLYFNKPFFLLVKRCDWCCIYQLLSVLTSFTPRSLSNQPLVQHQPTWLRPSHLGYNITNIRVNNIHMGSPLWCMIPCHKTLNKYVTTYANICNSKQVLSHRVSHTSISNHVIYWCAICHYLAQRKKNLTDLHFLVSLLLYRNNTDIKMHLHCHLLFLHHKKIIFIDFYMNI
jgi:hypothetical protein